MGFIADIAEKGISLDSGIGVPRSPTDRGQGRAIWREVFGATNKEEATFPQVRLIPGGSHSRSNISNPESYKRLLQAMRSLAPGGWSDNRWEQSKHFVGIQYVAIHRTCEQMAQSMFQVFHKDSRHPQGKRPVEEHEPEYDLVRLLEKPNGEDSFGEMMYRWNQQMDLTGMALTWMVPNVLGQPYELYSVPTAIAIPQPAINPDYPDGYYRIQPLYPYGPFSSYPTPASAVGAPIPAQWMLRFKYPHPLLRYDGYSPLTALRLHLDEIESMDRSRWYSMKRAINPSGVLNFDNPDGSTQPLPEEEIERIRAEFEQTQQGPENSGQLFVATPGAKLEPWGVKPVEMDYQAGWDQLVSFALGGLGITKPAAGMIDDASYSTLFATLKQFHLLTLEPKCNRISAQLTRNLAPFFGKDLIVEIKLQRIDDHDVKNAKLNLLMFARAATKNEIRHELGYHLTQEPWGDEIAGTEPMMPGQGQLGPDGQPIPGQEGQMGEPASAPPPPPLQSDEPPMPGGLKDEAPEISNSRPVPGKLGLGALGPRKSLNGRFKKKALMNGRT